MAAEQTNPVDVDEAVPPERLGPWVAEHVPGASGTVEVTQIAGGSSNLTFRVARRGARLGAAPAAAAPRPRDRARHGPRAPHAVGARRPPTCRSRRRSAACDDESVIGAPFYMMERLDGVVYDDVDATASLTEDQGLAASYELVDVLARLHAVDYEAVGLGDFGRPAGYLERQVERWQTQWEKSKTVEMPVGRRGRATPRTTPPHRQPPRDRPRRLQLQQHDVPPRRPHAHAGRPRLGDVDARRSAHRRRDGRGLLDRGRRDHVAQPQAAGAPRQRRLPRRRHAARALRDYQRHRPLGRSTSTARSRPTSWR